MFIDKFWPDSLVAVNLFRGRDYSTSMKKFNNNHVLTLKATLLSHVKSHLTCYKIETNGSRGSTRREIKNKKLRTKS